MPSLSTKKIVRWAVASVVLGLAIFFGLRYWLVGRHWVSTENAYVAADVIRISSQVTGQVAKLYVSNNDAVRAGQALFDVDPEPFRLAVDKAQAQLAMAIQDAEKTQAGVAEARAELARREAELENARHNAQRAQQLVAQKFMSPQAAEQSLTAVRTAEAALQAAQANVEQAQAAAGSAGPENEQVRAARAALEQAKLDLAHTHVVAPAVGLVSNMTLEAGSLVQANQPLFALIRTDEYWVDANFKETELTDVRPGQPAEIEVDMYPGHVFHGVVDSISGGSGTAFSLLPPQNATGNWVKVAQRVTVKVKIVDPDPHYPLRIGTSAEARVKTG